MEYTQWVYVVEYISPVTVLILVVMEYTQWAYRPALCRRRWGLNPCCNGIYSMSLHYKGLAIDVRIVLILVVMEYTQWEQRLTYPLYKAFWFIISMTAIVI